MLRHGYTSWLCCSPVSIIVINTASMHKALVSLRISIMLVHSNARDVAALMISVPLTAAIIAPTDASLRQQAIANAIEIQHANLWAFTV